MKRKIIIFVLALIIGGSGYAYFQYNLIFGPSVPTGLDDYTVKIDEDLGIEEVSDLLFNSDLINSKSAFEKTAKLMKVGTSSSIKGGMYLLEPNWSNREILQILRLGKQIPIKVTIVNERFVNDIAGVVAKQLKADSIEILDAILNPEMLDNIGVDEANAITTFIPNTYNLYWTDSGGDFIQRMNEENKKFWLSNNRVQKAEKLGYTPAEIYTIASIVERETQYDPEKKTIAGVYLNRLNSGIPLQADPTVVFANKIFSARRVLTKHLEVDSPYNTYQNQGLPPGPIGMASVSSIDAVLDAEDHEYIFFCAKADNSGTHAFAKTLREHNNNARKFHRWLNQRGIR